jgi:hypothetical protein
MVDTGHSPPFISSLVSKEFAVVGAPVADENAVKDAARPDAGVRFMGVIATGVLTAVAVPHPGTQAALAVMLNETMTSL